MKSKKIIVMAGGLGNQLFQLSAGLYIEKKLDYEVHYDISNLPIKKLKKNSKYARHLEILELLPVGRVNRTPIRIHNFLINLGRFSKSKRLFFESEVNGDSLNKITDKNRLIIGFFQSAQLADEMWPEIEKLMRNSKSFSPIFSMSEFDRICVHLRFGDYKNDLDTKLRHGFTEIDYYAKAVRTLKQKNKNINNLLIVTDSADEAKAFIKGVFSDFIVEIKSSQNSIEDLTDLALSKNIVISNSTFSWWGAFIASKLRNSNVIYPRPWLADFSDPHLPIYYASWQSMNRSFTIS